MSIDKVELVIHPVRLRILQCLEHESLTTQEIAEQMPDIPKSSLYRHLRLLLENELISVAEMRLVQGIQEKVYELRRPAHLDAEDMRGLSPDDHLRFFTIYLMTLLRGFANYLADAQEIDYVADRVGYNEVTIYASDNELDAFAARLNESITPLLGNDTTPGRRRRRIAVINYPLRNKRKDDE